MIDNLIKLQIEIAKFILNHLIVNRGFVGRSFYSETFCLYLLYVNGLLDPKLRKLLFRAYENIDKANPEFHWEFNNYSLLQYQRISNDESVKRYLEPLRFTGTKVTNWTLLRSNTRLLANSNKVLAIREAKRRIRNYQLSSGLIIDDKGVRSFQYHCFSMAMVAEIFDHTKDVFFLYSFRKGVNFIRNFILSNGETLYIGRGQNQTFGYGALIYILALAYRYFGDTTILGDLEKVYGYLIQFQREDGSLPLVLNSIENGIPKVINPRNTNFPGWYPYNNYFDYLPFFGVFIAKAANVLKELGKADISFSIPCEYIDRDFIKVVKPHYEAVLSRPGGYWTNDMPIPYIVHNNKSIMPCYGGEQFQESIYTLKGIPLPYCELIKKSIRWKSYSFLRKNVLWLFSPLGLMRRRYSFGMNKIKISTIIYSILPFKHLYLFLENTLDICEDIKEMKFEGVEYSASGMLYCYSIKGYASTITIKVQNES